MKEKVDIYKNVEFYEKVGDRLIGPIKGIRFTEPVNPNEESSPDMPDYIFCQIMNDRIVRVFTKDEMVEVNKTIKQ